MIIPERLERNSWWLSRYFVWFCIVYFLLAGLFLTLLASFAGPSFWYVPLGILLSLTAFAWYSPAKGAACSLPPTLGFVFWLIEMRPWQWHEGLVISLGLPAIVFSALVLCLFALYKTKPLWKLTAISVAAIFAALLIDRVFTDRVEVRTVTMQWRVDGRSPNGDETQLGPNGEIPVVIYEQIGGGYCYDAIFSEELKHRLNVNQQNQIKVQYNIFRSFGQETGYNVRTIAGMEFNDDHKSLISEGGYGGMIETVVSDKTGGHSVAPSCSR
jgi:hypothetical protein